MANPRISEVTVKGLRALADVTLQLGGLTVLIGDNGSGKSSLIEACELLRRAADGSFAEDLRKIHGGPRSLLRFGADRLELGVRVVSGADEYAYSFALDEAGEILSESLLHGRDESAPLLTRGECSKGPHIEVVSEEPGREKKEEAHVRPRDLGLPAFWRKPPHRAVTAVLEALGGIDVHLPFDTGPRWAQRSRGLPSPLRDAATIEPIDGLDRFGHNLANAFSALKNDFSEAHWRETMDDVRLGLGRDVESINVRADPAGGAIALRLKYAGLDEQVPAFSLSDGMLSYLCFVALYRLNAGKSLIAFDEPDVHLHPELLMRVLGFLESMSRDVPLLLATHSDRLLDGLTDPASSVVLCELDERRATRLVRPDAAALADWLTDYRGLGELRTAGHAASVLTRREDS